MSGTDYDDEEEYEYEDEVGSEPERSTGRFVRAERGLAVGFLALVPLLLAYELGLSAGGGATRNSSELALFYGTIAFGGHADLARRVILGACTLGALVASFRADLGLVPVVWRQVLEGALAALILGPALILGVIAAEAGLGPLTDSMGSAPPLGAPGLVSAGLVLGGAAYEELLFRLGLLSLLVLGARTVWAFLVGARPARASAVGVEGVCWVLSSLAFAAFHLETFTGWLGPGGEPWNAAVFTWRVLAGMLLAGLFRWRGIGVAAWAHGLFNLALVLGAGPDVFL